MTGPKAVLCSRTSFVQLALYLDEIYTSVYFLAHQADTELDFFFLLLTVIYVAITLPLVFGSVKTSAYNPPTTALGLAPKRPSRNLNPSNAFHDGVNAHAMVNSAKQQKGITSSGLRP